MDTFCEKFDQEQDKTPKSGSKKKVESKDDTAKGEQDLNSLLKEIQEKETKLNSLRKKYEDLIKQGNLTFWKASLNTT